MLEFFLAYGSWIVFGLFFLLMLRMHGSGGCGMGHHQRGEQPAQKATGTDKDGDDAPDRQPPAKRSSSCH